METPNTKLERKRTELHAMLVVGLTLLGMASTAGPAQATSDEACIRETGGIPPYQVRVEDCIPCPPNCLPNGLEGTDDSP